MEEIEPEEELAGEGLVESELAASVLGNLGKRQRSIASILVQDENIRKLTHFFTRKEPILYAKAAHLADISDALDAMDGTEEVHLPSLNGLLLADYQHRKSYQYRTGRFVVAITHIFERIGEAARGIWRRR